MTFTYNVDSLIWMIGVLLAMLFLSFIAMLVVHHKDVVSDDDTTVEDLSPWLEYQLEIQSPYL